MIRVVWRHSRFYNTADRLTGLLRKVSNEIINRCRASISISQIFDGDVKGEEAHLQQSISACEAWLVLYSKTAAAVERERDVTGREWDLDMSNTQPLPLITPTLTLITLTLTLTLTPAPAPTLTPTLAITRRGGGVRAARRGWGQHGGR